MRTHIVNALTAHFTGHIEKHRMNVEIMLANPLAIHDHTDLMSAMEKEIEQLVEYEDKLAALNKYFNS